MVAPKGPGHIVRRQYLEGKGVPTLIAVHKNPGKKAKKIALAWAKGIGGTRAGVLRDHLQGRDRDRSLRRADRALRRRFSALVKAGFEVLVEAGYQPEMAYFECLHELKLIVDLMNESGIAGMRFSISETAKYGDVTVGPKIIDAYALGIDYGTNSCRSLLIDLATARLKIGSTVGFPIPPARWASCSIRVTRTSPARIRRITSTAWSPSRAAHCPGRSPAPRL
jgi:hypothetical protein